jgi:hypothetical protein
LNLTIALLAGLVVLLPGLTALASWNFLGSGQSAKRPELQLTSVNGLFVVLIVAAILHFLGFALTGLAWAAAAELDHSLPAFWPRWSLLPNPYDAAVSTATGAGQPTPGAIAAFLFIVLVECLFAARLMASEGLDLALEGVDLRSQGWIFQNIVRPSRHKYKPIAFVLTAPPQGEYGIGYEGVIADVRQGDNGELKSVSLAEPQRFIYHIVPKSDSQPRLRPHLEIYDREWVGGIVTLDAASVRNIVIHNIPDDVVNEVEAADPCATTLVELELDASNPGTDIDDCPNEAPAKSEMTGHTVNPQECEGVAERPIDDLDAPFAAHEGLRATNAAKPPSKVTSAPSSPIAPRRKGRRKRDDISE